MMATVRKNYNHIFYCIFKKISCFLYKLQVGDLDELDRTAGAIRGRSGRICNVVSAEMDNYEPGYYTGRVMEAVKLLSERVMPNFAEKVEAYVIKLTTGQELTQMDQNEFIGKLFFKENYNKIYSAPGLNFVLN